MEQDIKSDFEKQCFEVRELIDKHKDSLDVILVLIGEMRGYTKSILKNFLDKKQVLDKLIIPESLESKLFNLSMILEDNQQLSFLQYAEDKTRQLLQIEKLSQEHKSILAFINKSFLNISVNLQETSLEDVENQIMRILVFPNFSVEHKPGDYIPGMVLIKDLKGTKDYDNTKESLYNHAEQLLVYLKESDIPQKTIAEIRHFLNSFLGLKLKYITDDEVDAVDLLTIQQVKKVLSDIVRIAALDSKGRQINPYKESASDTNSLFRTVKESFSKSFEKENLREKMKDQLFLSIIANFYDNATSAVRPLVNRLKYKEEKDHIKLLYLICEGKVPNDIFKSNADVLDILNREKIIHRNNDNFVFKENVKPSDINSFSDISQEDKGILIELLSLTTNSLISLNNDEVLKQKTEDLIEKLLHASNVTLLVSNMGEVFFDLNFIKYFREITQGKIKVQIIARQNAVENDVDISKLKEIIRNNFDTDFRKNVSIIENHSSAMLGVDVNTLPEDMKASFKKDSHIVISKGLGNFLTMQGVDFDVTHLFLSKGFMGRKISKMITGVEKPNAPLIIDLKAKESYCYQHLRQNVGQDNERVQIEKTINYLVLNPILDDSLRKLILEDNEWIADFLGEYRYDFTKARFLEVWNRLKENSKKQLEFYAGALEIIYKLEELNLESKVASEIDSIKDYLKNEFINRADFWITEISYLSDLEKVSELKQYIQAKNLVSVATCKTGKNREKLYDILQKEFYFEEKLTYPEIDSIQRKDQKGKIGEDFIITGINTDRSEVVLGGFADVRPTTSSDTYYGMMMAIDDSVQGLGLGSNLIRGIAAVLIMRGAKYLDINAPVFKTNSLINIASLGGEVIDLADRNLSIIEKSALDTNSRADRFVIRWDLEKILRGERGKVIKNSEEAFLLEEIISEKTDLNVEECKAYPEKVSPAILEFVDKFERSPLIVDLFEKCKKRVLFSVPLEERMQNMSEDKSLKIQLASKLLLDKIFKQHQGEYVINGCSLINGASLVYQVERKVA